MKTSKTFVITFFLVFGQLLYSQNNKECSFIIECLKSDEFKEHFKVCDIKTPPLIMVDLIEYFNCDTVKLCERVIIFDSNVQISLNPNKISGKETMNMILFEYKKKKRKTMVVFFWQPYTNANLILKIKKKRDSYKIETLVRGVF